MGIGCVIHGFIEAPGWGSQPPSVRVFRHNKRVIASLPENDAEWPFITRSMFSFLPLTNTRLQRIPQYESALIHFAGSYKNEFVLSSAWIAKFERLLKNLCWDKAVVYAEFAGIRYEWTADWLTESFFNNPPLPPQSWTLKCFKVGDVEIPYADAIDGSYPP